MRMRFIAIIKSAIVIFLILAAISLWLWLTLPEWKMIVPFIGSLLCAATEWWTLIQWKKYD